MKSKKYGESATWQGIPHMHNSRNIFLFSTACWCCGTFGCMYCVTPPSCCLSELRDSPDAGLLAGTVLFAIFRSLSDSLQVWGNLFAFLQAGSASVDTRLVIQPGHHSACTGAFGDCEWSLHRSP